MADMQGGEPDAKRRRVQTTLMFARKPPATPQTAQAQMEAEAKTREEWTPRIGEGWCKALLPILRTGCANVSRR